MPRRHLEVPLSPVFRWNAIAPVGIQLAGALLVALAGWALLATVYPDRQGRILANWTFRTGQAEAVGADDAAALLNGQGESSLAFEWLRLPPRETSSFGDLALNLEFPVALSPGDTVSAARQVCPADGEQLVFYVSTPFKRTEKSGAFVLRLLQDGRELWSLNLPAATRPLVYRVPVAGRCSQLEFQLSTRVGVKSESWRRASRTEIIFPRLERVTAPALNQKAGQ